MYPYALLVRTLMAVTLTEVTNGFAATEQKPHWISEALRPMTEYLKFRKQYPRKYASVKEVYDRFENFKKTLRRIEVSNRQLNTTLYGITEFADWYSYELEKFKISGVLNDLIFRGPSDQFSKPYISSGKTLPKYFSWLKSASESRVRDQLHDRGVACNSCWANTILSIIEILYKIQFNDVIHLSDDELIDCDISNNHCISGSTKRGFIRGRTIGYKMKDNYSKDEGCPTYWDIKVAEIYSFPKTAHNIMAEYIANHGPIAVNIAWPAMMFSYSGFGIVRGDACARNARPEHAVVLLGYGEEDGVKYWILKNSYGTSWGNNGYFRLERGVDACRVESYAMSASLKRSNTISAS